MDPKLRRQAAFQDTRWTMVRRATDPDQKTIALRAMGEFCADYWYPVYAFLRRRGYPREEAEDQTQVFFNQIANGGVLAAADPEDGRLRNFLLKQLQKQLKAHREREGAQKRGGHLEKLSLDFESAEGRLRNEPESSGLTPEEEFARAWAFTTLEIAIRRLGESWSDQGKGEEFDALRKFLHPGQIADSTAAELADQLGVNEANARQKVRRIRDAFSTFLRDQIGDSLSDPSDESVEAELQNLRAALGT